MFNLLNFMDGFVEGLFEGVISNWSGEIIGFMFAYCSGIWQILMSGSCGC